jgi:predicted RNA-binding protein
MEKENLKRKVFIKTKENKVTSISIIKNEIDEIETEVYENDLTKFFNNLENLKYINSNIVIIEQDEQKIQMTNILNGKILNLTNYLKETDYKIIKCYEASIRQLPLPYNLEELAAQRDAWRAEINQLEQELENL